jgi:serine/threonine-protein kinase
MATLDQDGGPAAESRPRDNEKGGIDSQTLSAGFQFGSYVVHSCIGRGAMARVYRAEHSGLRKPVALKVMERSLLQRPDGSRRFLREGQAAAAVKHQNVVDITDVGVWQGLPYLIMELLEGDDLEAYLAERGPLSGPDLARFMLPILSGLAAAHDSGVVHRDLKPSNIFLSRGSDGEILPKILDFGISKYSSINDIDLTATPSGELMGSPLYMSPEAVRGARDLTAQSDQYSLGVILYECMTGRPPFDFDVLLPLLEAVASGDFKPPREYRPDLSPALERAILRAMSLKPAQRFGHVRELGQALWQVSEGRTRLLWSPAFGYQNVALEGRFDQGHSTLLSTPAVSAQIEPKTRHPSSPKRWGRRLGLGALLATLVGSAAYWQGMTERVMADARPEHEALVEVTAVAGTSDAETERASQPERRQVAREIAEAMPAPVVQDLPAAAPAAPVQTQAKPKAKTRARAPSVPRTSRRESAASRQRALERESEESLLGLTPSPEPARSKRSSALGVNDSPILD